MVFTLNDFAVLNYQTASTPKGPKPMNKLRCFLFAAIAVLFSATFAMGGDIQTPGRSDPPPPPPASASATDSTTAGIITPPSTDEIQVGWQDLTTTMLRELLLAIY
jgi:hypothetical protein